MKEDNSKVREYLERLLPYCKVNRAILNLRTNYSLDNDFSWVTEQHETLKKEILHAINQVSDHKVREIMKLRYIDGNTVREICSLLGFSSKSYYKFLSRGYREIALPITEKI